MNYAWSNPSTGIREQTSHSTPERMLAEAKLRMWEEAQELFSEQNTTIRNWLIHRQEAIGKVTVDGFRLAVTPPYGYGDHDFAWTDPATGKRIVSESLDETALVDALKRCAENRDSKDSIIIYATWPECTVSTSDPRPADLPPEEMPETDDRRAGDAPEVERYKKDLETVTVLDDGVKLAKITAWALLDIAMTLREMSGDLRYPDLSKEKQ